MLLSERPACTQHGSRGVFLPAHRAHDFLKRNVPPSRLSIAITWLVLLSSRGAFGMVSPVGVFFSRVAFLVALSQFGRDVGRLFATVALGFAGGNFSLNFYGLGGWCLVRVGRHLRSRLAVAQLVPLLGSQERQLHVLLRQGSNRPGSELLSRCALLPPCGP